MIHHRKFLWSMILLIGAITLVSCGGGGGGNGTPTPTPAGGTVIKFAILDGTQESPTVTTTSNGSGSLTVDTATGAVSGSLTILSAPATTVTAAHVHDAAAGNAVIIPLSDSGGGVWSVPATATPLTAAQIASFTAGSLYFNVHTDANKGGEIRGNINKTSATLNAHLNGAQEATPVTTIAEGTGSMTVDAGTGAASGSLTIVVAPATTVTAAHVHDAAAGDSVIIPLSDSGGGVWSIPAGTVLTAAQIASFIGGKLYFNVHTTANKGGEIRGNIVLVTPPTVTAAVVTKLAILDGNQEIPAVTTTAGGSGSLTVDTGTRIVLGSLTILSAPATTVTAAHVHDAAAGDAVAIPLIDSGGGVWSVPANTVLTPAQVASFIAGSLYFNVHTAVPGGFPNGEIRGNINTTSATLFARLAAIPPVVTSATGTGSLTFDIGTGVASGSVTITVAPVSAVTEVHVHDAALGEAIAVISLTNSGGGVWSIPANTLLTTAQAASFISGRLNFTVHTATNTGGEIRGAISLIAP